MKMRTLLLAAALLMAGMTLNSQRAQAQDIIAKWSPVGVFINTGAFVNNASYAQNFEVEYAFNESMSGSFGLGFNFSGFGGTGIFFRPEFSYYLAGSAPEGFYAGAFVDFGIYTFGTVKNFGVGGQGGYQTSFLDGRLVVDGNLHMGFGRFFGGGFGTGGFRVYPNASVGWNFGAI